MEDNIKDDILTNSIEWCNPGKTREWRSMGVDLVIGRREGYYLYDMSGKRLIDVHLNGGTYNLGHRNPEIIETLIEGLKDYDIGNHHFPSITRARLAEELARITPEGLRYSIYGSSGGEAIDVALKCARYATKRKKIISIEGCYHGHTGLAVSAGNERYSSLFLSEGDPREFVHVPFNDVAAMEAALSQGDAACVIMETIPATYGFPMPQEGYLKQVRELCTQYGSLYIADEVQTGLMRTGELWGVDAYGVKPDILVTAKGLSGGIYPITVAIVNNQAGQWLLTDGSAHMSTFGGSELGCLVALKVLEICQRPETRDNVNFVSRYLSVGLQRIRGLYPDFFTGIRQKGLIMGLEFNHPEGAKYVMSSLYANGVWAIYSMLNPSVLQFKPGLLYTKELCNDLLGRVETAIGQAEKIARPK